MSAIDAFLSKASSLANRWPYIWLFAAVGTMIVGLFLDWWLSQ